MRYLITLVVLFLAGCGGGESGSGVEQSATETEFEQVKLNGLWKGRIESEFNGSHSDVTLAAIDNAVYLVEFYGPVSVGTANALTEDEYSLSLESYGSYRVNFSVDYRTNLLAKKTGKAFNIDLTFNEDNVFSGRYTEIQDGQTIDTGTVTMLEYVAIDSPFGYQHTTEKYEFTCGGDTLYPLTCFSMIAIDISAEGEVVGLYKDGHGYQTQEDITTRIPSEKPFTGSVERIPGTDFYKYQFSLSETGGAFDVMTGIGWGHSFITLTDNGRLMFSMQ